MGMRPALWVWGQHYGNEANIMGMRPALWVWGQHYGMRPILWVWGQHYGMRPTLWVWGQHYGNRPRWWYAVICTGWRVQFQYSGSPDKRRKITKKRKHCETAHLDVTMPHGECIEYDWDGTCAVSIIFDTLSMRHCHVQVGSLTMLPLLSYLSPFVWWTTVLELDSSSCAYDSIPSSWPIPIMLASYP